MPGASHILPRLVLVLWGLTGSQVQAASADAFADCATQFAAAPRAYDSALCFYLTATRTGQWEVAGKRLLELERADPKVIWLRLVRAHVYWNSGTDGAEDLYRQAADEFQAVANLRGELVARSNLRTLLFRTGRVQQAGREIQRIGEIAASTEDPELKIRAYIDQSHHDIDTGTNLSRAHNTLLQAREQLSPSHPYWMRKEVLTNLGVLDVRFGRYHDAVEQFRMLEAEAKPQGDLVGLALARFNVANATFEMLVEEPRRGGHDQAAELAQAALDAAREAQWTPLLAAAHRLLAELYLIEDPARARGHLVQCTALAAELGEPGVQSECMWSEARILARSDAAAAQRLIADAVELMETHEDIPRLAHAWRHHMRIGWHTRPFPDALENAERALQVFESLRDLQADERGRTGVLSAWARDYYWLSGRLLEAAEQRSDDSLVAHAFLVTERMRARALLEALETAAPPDPLPDAVTRERQQVLQAIVDRNRQLLVAAEDNVRVRLLDELESLELQELALRNTLTHTGGRAPSQLPSASLSAVQSALAPDEALLSFQISPWKDISDAFAGGAWLIVVTGQATQAVRLPGRTELVDSTTVARGMMDGGPSSADVEILLFRRIFRDALDRLPEQITRLVIVPDDPLHRFPVAALRQDVHGNPLGVDYELSFVPSATLWRLWRTGAEPGYHRDALVLANPQIAASDTAQAAQWRSWAMGSGLDLGPLPYAESEGRHVRARLGGRSEMLTGPEASEAALKSLPLETFGILHFATHAVIDEAHPERSAVVLAAGDRHEDGLLQVREIVDLPLQGQVVVLSSCQSATGTHVRGEGVQGLARAFFAAGASAVIGSLWPMRDDHAAAFFDAFYESLAGGRPVGTAVRSAQQSLRSRGYPMDAWAGFQVMGDGASMPIAEPMAGRSQTLPLVVMVLLGAAIGALWLVFRLTQRRSASG